MVSSRLLLLHADSWPRSLRGVAISDFVLVAQPGDSFIIVACDGLWDELSNHEAVTRCANFLRLAEDSERGGVAQVRMVTDWEFCTAFPTLHDPTF